MKEQQETRTENTTPHEPDSLNGGYTGRRNQNGDDSNESINLKEGNATGLEEQVHLQNHQGQENRRQESHGTELRPQNPGHINDLVKIAFFADMGKAIASANSVRETLDTVMEHIGKMFAPAYWSLLLKDPKTGNLKFTLVVGSGVEALHGQELPRGKGIAGWIAEKGRSVIVEDVSRDPRFDPEMDRQTSFTTKSIIGVPLKSKNKVFGVIELINKLNGEFFTPYELTLLQTIADFAAIAIEKSYYLRSLKRIASVDSLTGLYNRRIFQRFMDKEISRIRRAGGSFTLMMIDIDHFKRINDTYGHAVGDKVLKKVAEIVSRLSRAADVVCRFGGDEFLVLLPGAGEKEALILKERVTEHLQTCNADGDIQISLSFGIHPVDKENTHKALEVVDADMYADKQAKKEQVEQTIMDIPAHIGDLLDENLGQDELSTEP